MTESNQSLSEKELSTIFQKQIRKGLLLSCVYLFLVPFLIGAVMLLFVVQLQIPPNLVLVFVIPGILYSLFRGARIHFVGKDQYQAIAIKEEDGKLSGFKIDSNKKLDPLSF